MVRKRFLSQASAAFETSSRRKTSFSLLYGRQYHVTLVFFQSTVSMQARSNNAIKKGPGKNPGRTSCNGENGQGMRHARESDLYKELIIISITRETSAWNSNFSGSDDTAAILSLLP
jgi:hypothetical protein